ncbi:hypothetical protein [Prevotella sp. HUN102]|nr:hypothetical protein [Prevotella sp. HUN102]
MSPDDGGTPTMVESRATVTELSSVVVGLLSDDNRQADNLRAFPMSNHG